MATSDPPKPAGIEPNNAKPPSRFVLAHPTVSTRSRYPPPPTNTKIDLCYGIMRPGGRVATVNFETKELSVKVVYFGTEETACNDVVRQIHTALPNKERSELLHFAKQGGAHSWYFDHQPEESLNLKFKARFQTYSLPFEAASPTHRSEILAQADLIVALVDARPEFETRNIESLLGLEEGLELAQRKISDTPILLKITQGEHAESRTTNDVAFAINPHGFTVLAHAQGEQLVMQALHQEVLREALELISQAVSDPESARIRITTTQAKYPGARETLKAHLRAFVLNNEEAISSYDRPHWTPVEFDTLDSHHRIDVKFHIADYPEYLPTRVLTAEVDHGRIHLNLALQHPETEDAKQAHIVLRTSVESHSEITDEPGAPDQDWDRFGDSLPMTIEISRPKTAETSETKLSLAVVGLAAGIIIGLGLGFLVWG